MKVIHWIGYDVVYSMVDRQPHDDDNGEEQRIDESDEEPIVPDADTVA